MLEWYSLWGLESWWFVLHAGNHGIYSLPLVQIRRPTPCLASLHIQPSREPRKRFKSCMASKPMQAIGDYICTSFPFIQNVRSSEFYYTDQGIISDDIRHCELLAYSQADTTLQQLLLWMTWEDCVVFLSVYTIMQSMAAMRKLSWGGPSLVPRPFPPPVFDRIL